MTPFASLLLRFRAFFGSADACHALALRLLEAEAYRAAVRKLIRSAHSDHVMSQYELGRCYLLGLGIPPSIQDALRWFGKAATGGDVRARTQLAELALQGVRHPGNKMLFGGADIGEPDWDAAQRWAQLASDQGSAQAKALLGFILTAGPAERLDPLLGENLYRESAQAGWHLGQLGLALLRLKQGRAHDARVLLAAAAAQGVPLAHYWLGALLETGAGGGTDLPGAAAQYHLAAEKGHATAQMRYGFALLNGRGVPRETFGAETWLRRAALGGETQAAAVLGLMFAQAIGQPPNYNEAGVWLRRAAEAGHAGAARTLGQLHLLGLGMQPDLEEAIAWLHMSAAGGDAAARTDLAALLLSGQVSDPRILAWLRDDGESGDGAALFRLGLCHANGLATPVDLPAARDCFLRAAGLGLADGAAVAAEMLVNGRGGPTDVEQGMALFRTAAAEGHAGAQYALGVLLSDQDQLRQAACQGHVPAQTLLERICPAA